MKIRNLPRNRGINHRRQLRKFKSLSKNESQVADNEDKNNYNNKNNNNVINIVQICQ